MRLPFWESESLVENFAHMKQKHKYKINNLRLDALKIVKAQLHFTLVTLPQTAQLSANREFWPPTFSSGKK